MIRCIRHGRQGGCGGNHPQVPAGIVARIAIHGITGGKAPAILTITFIFFGVIHAVPVMDQGVVFIEFPVICKLVLQAFRIQSQIGIMRPEKRAYGRVVVLIMVEFRFQLVKRSVPCDITCPGPALFVDRFCNRVGG